MEKTDSEFYVKMPDFKLLATVKNFLGFLMWTILKSLLNLLQYCFCFMLFVFSAARHVQTQLPDQGLNPHPVLRKVKSESLDHQRSPTTFKNVDTVQPWKTYFLSQFSSVQLLSRVWLFATPWIAARQASLSITNSRSLLKLMPIESVMPSSHLILCHPLLLLPPIPPRITVFSI